MSHAEHRLATSVLVIGAGGSGLRAAIELAESGADVLAVGKRPARDAHTTLAAGGINAALATMDPEDSWQQHAADTIKESYLLAHPRTVRDRGARSAPRHRRPASATACTSTASRTAGSRSATSGRTRYRRTAFAGDYTGLEIQRALVDRATRQLDVPILDRVYVTRLLVADGPGLRRLRVRPDRRHPLPDPRRRRHSCHRRSHPDLATHLVTSRREHRRLHAPGRRSRRTPARPRAGAVPPLRDPRARERRGHARQRGSARRGRCPAQRARRAVHGRYDPDRMELSTRDRVALAATPRSRKAAAPRTAGSGSMSPTCPATRS